ncbi:MAG: hypothetical protein JNM76_14755 [Betaproteobacteria bacterium]|nr:hypothetical protein [Betaproteobacteria bacterium]
MEERPSPKPSRRLRMAVRLALHLPPLPSFDAPLFILPSPSTFTTAPYSLPFWALRGNVEKWWNALQLQAFSNVATKWRLHHVTR